MLNQSPEITEPSQAYLAQTYWLKYKKYVGSHIELKPHFKQIITNKRRLRRAWQASRSLHSKTLLKSASLKLTRIPKLEEANA